MESITIGCTATDFPPLLGSKPVREPGFEAVKNPEELTGSQTLKLGEQTFEVVNLYAATAINAGRDGRALTVLGREMQRPGIVIIVNIEIAFVRLLKQPVLKQILHEDHSNSGFEKGSRYLEQKHQFLQNRDTAQGGQ